PLRARRSSDLPELRPGRASRKYWQRGARRAVCAASDAVPCVPLRRALQMAHPAAERAVLQQARAPMRYAAAVLRITVKGSDRRANPAAPTQAATGLFP